MSMGQMEQMLQTYKADKCRLKQLGAQLSQLEARFEYEVKKAYEAKTLGAQQYDGIPTGKVGSVSDPTARLAAMMADGAVPKELRTMDKERDILKIQIAQCRAQLDYVDAWLESLSGRDGYIVRQKAIEGLSWAELEGQFEREFGYALSVSTLRRSYKMAVDSCAA